jgi:hypothetical protein
MMLMYPMKMHQARTIVQDGVFCQQWNGLSAGHVAAWMSLMKDHTKAAL